MSDSTLPVAVPVTAITGTEGIHPRTLPISRYSRLISDTFTRVSRERERERASRDARHSTR
jgi:hypothetical protein